VILLKELRKTKMSETLIETAPQPHVGAQPQPPEAKASLAPPTLENVGSAIQSFYGGENHFMGRTPEGEFRSIVTKNEDGTSSNETIGSGEDPSSAVENALEGMRSLETAQTRPLIRMKMTDEAAVDFTELGHYSPKIAPSTEAHSVPDYLEGALTDSPIANMTYKETVAQEGWDKQLTGIVSGYLTGSEHGRRLGQELKITDLSALTPEQAVKLSLSVVQNLSKYSRDEQGKPDGQRADGLTAMQLLQEGTANKADPNWQGNGVCRNIASNTKAVFEALKLNQGDHSMLRNTYAVFETGHDGEGYDNRREDVDEKNRTITLNPKVLPGHAWVKFVTVDGKGSANIAIVDPTWALERDAPTALQHMDYTLPRMAKMAGELFAKSDHKKEAFDELTYYYDQLEKKSVRDRVGPERRAKVRQFEMTEYLKAAEAVLPELGEGDNILSVPRCVTVAAYQLKDKLQDKELETLYKVSQFAPIENIGAIVESYAKGTTVSRPEWQTIERLVKPNEGLQAEVFKVLGEQGIIDFADKNGKFRDRVRGLMPDALPSFDPINSPADAKELSFLAEKGHIHERDPRHIVREVQRRLKKEAGDDALFEAATFGRSDYDLVKNYVGLRERITKVAKSRSTGHQ
jgi:hypothetical protein